MAREKTSMTIINEILRMLELGVSDRLISKTLAVSRNTVAKMRLNKDLSEDKIPNQEEVEQTTLKQSNVDWDDIRRDFLSGTPLTILWQEQFESNKITVQYPAFWKQYNKRFPESKISMHRVFAPGSRTEIDYCDGIDFYCRTTGEVISTQFFVGVLCCSRYAFAEFTLSQKSTDFLSSHSRMFEFFGGVTDTLSPDNLKSAVSKVHKYDPVINPAYTRLAEYYNIGVVPARVKTPKDKAIVERTIQIFQRWFYALVRKRTFASLVELNACLREHLPRFNEKVHRVFKRSRKEMFDVEKKHLGALPELPYNIAIHTTANIHPDCHVSFEKNYYSAPHDFRGQRIDIWATDKIVEIFHDNNRIATHNKLIGHGQFSTIKSHYPEAHKCYAEATPSFLMSIAKSIGPETNSLVAQLLDGETPLRNLRRAQGVVRLGKVFDHFQLEEACKKAMELNQLSYGFIERVLKNNSSLLSKARIKNAGNQEIKRGDNEFLRGDELIN